MLGGDFLTVIAYVAGRRLDPLAHALLPLRRLAGARDDGELLARRARTIPIRAGCSSIPSIDGAVLERLIPYSTLVNAASTKALWDKVLAAKGGAS